MRLMSMMLKPHCLLLEAPLCSAQPQQEGGGVFRFPGLLGCLSPHSSISVTSKTSYGRQMGCGDEILESV